MTFVKKCGFWVFLMLLASQAISAQNTLTIEVVGLKNSNGNIVLELCNSDKEIVEGVIQELKSTQCTLQINNLAAGQYTFRYFHDENRNSEIDTRCFVIPKEGFGFSNNAKGKFGPPEYQETLFELRQDTTMQVKPLYY